MQAGITSIYTGDTKPYDDLLVADDGRRVIQVLIETNTRLIGPNLEWSLLVEHLRRPA